MKILTFALMTLVGCASHQKSAETVKPQVFVYESNGNGFNTKTFFYDNGEEVVAIDTQFTGQLAMEALEFLKTKTKNPVSYAIVTHPNPDKFNGIAAFKQAGAQVIASDVTAQSMPGVHAYKKYFFVNMAKMFTEETYPQLIAPDKTFNGTHTIKLGNGEEIRLVELNKPGVSSNQTLVHIPRVNALFVGDLIHHKAHAWLEGGIVKGSPRPTIASWIAVVENLPVQFPRSTVYGGRGESGKVEEVSKQQAEYLKKIDQIVTEYVKSVGQKKADPKVIQKKAEAAFGDYQLGYMIQYGVYGLVNSK